MLKSRDIFIAILFSLIFIIAPSLFAKEILVPVDSFPPFHIFPQNSESPYGEVISILRAVVDNVNKKNGWQIKMTFTKDTPFERCLKMMRNGNADLIGGILDKGDRKEYMHLLKYKPNSNKIFLLRMTDANDIFSLEDLKGQTVGTIIGYVYFKNFDKDPQIKKDPVRNISISLTKLKFRRYNVVICTETEWITLQENDPEFASNFKPATFRYEKDNPVYLGISKKSWLSKPEYLNAFKQIVEEMFVQKKFNKIISEFYDSNYYNLKNQ